MERIERVLDKLTEVAQYDWHKNEDGTWYGLVEFWTNTAGQDIPTEFKFDGTAEDFVKQFCEAAENYDVDEEVELFVDMRGKNGVPNTVRELLDDCQEAKDTLMKVAKALKNAKPYIKPTKEERREWKQYLYSTLCFLATERPEFAPRKRDSLNTLLESFFYWASEYNDGYFSERDEADTDRYCAWLVQEYEEMGY